VNTAVSGDLSLDGLANTAAPPASMSYRRILRRMCRTTILALPALCVLPPAVQSQSIPSCADDPAFAVLDFWVGEWNVFTGSDLVGTNRIDKVLSGCAVVEHWRAEGGGEGMSLFYYQPAARKWKQVWVTQTPASPGGVKEKELVETLPDGALRFQGSVPLVEGGTYHDRTTLTPLADGTVRQVIEFSRDGLAWQISFAAIYRRRNP
jgi:hypothetical protein